MAKSAPARAGRGRPRSFDRDAALARAMLNGEIKRRTEVVGTFPNQAAITRLIGANLLE